MPCRINIFLNSRPEVELLKSEAMIVSDQTTTFYGDDGLIGGCFIETSIYYFKKRLKIVLVCRAIFFI